MDITNDPNYHILIFPRSSISKYNLQLCNSVGVIDNGYQGELLLRFDYIWQPEDYNIVTNQHDKKLIKGNINPDRIYQKDDRIGQLVFYEHISKHIEFIRVNEFEKSDRGTNGLGSIAQVDLLERVHHNQPLPSLSKMSFAIMQVILGRLDKAEKIDLLKSDNLAMNFIRYEFGNYFLEAEEIHDYERPPMIELLEYRQKRGLEKPG